MTPRTYWQTHKGKRICVLDFRAVTDTGQALQAIADAAKVVRAEPPSSVRTLTLVEKSVYNRQIGDELKNLANGNRPHVKAAAVVGLSGLQHALYIAIQQFSGRTISTFRDAERAKDWLVSKG